MSSPTCASRAPLWFLPAVALWLGTGCHEVDTTACQPGEDACACETEADCPAASTCEAGLCVAATAADGGGLDTSLPDIGATEVVFGDTAAPSDASNPEPDPDAATPDVPVPDVPEPTCGDAPLAEFCACRENADCASGFCIPSQDGGSTCTRTCEATCARGRECLLVTLPGLDPTYLCVDPQLNLCRPCTDDAECQADSLGVSGARCVRYGPEAGSFCGLSCAADADCPEAYACREVEALESGARIRQCVLADEGATCACSGRSVAQGAFTRCTQNRCEGVRVCEADGLSDCADQSGNPCALAVPVDITFDPQGGLLVGAASRTVNLGQPYGPLPEATREGYTLSAWRTEPGGLGSAVLADTLVTVSEAHTLYAAWDARRFIVTFDSVNGSACPARPVSFGATYGAEAPLCVPTRTGHGFSGWRLASEAGPPVNDATVVTTAADHTLVAVWVADGVTVTLDSAGGTPCAPFAATFGQAYGPLCTPVRPGFVFAGWADPSGAPVNETSLVENPDDHTLEAQWTALPFTVTFDPNRGTDPNPATLAVVFDAPYGPLAVTSRIGHLFGGWWTSPDGPGVEILPASPVAIPRDHTLFARWKAVRATVTFDAEGGTPCDDRTVTYGQLYGVDGPLCTPTRAGYTFAGWWTGDDGAGEQVEATTPVSTPGPHTLHARWTANRYTVTFESAGGSACDSLLVTYRQPYGPLCEPTRAGWSFVGWHLTPDGAGPVNAETLVATASNHTLHARWSANAYTVSFDSEGGTDCPSRAVTYGQTYGASGPLCTPTRPGHVFAGWFAGDGGTGDPVLANTVMSRTSDHTVHAGWTPATLTVSYDNANGVGCSSKAVVYGEAYGPLCVPTRAGYVFGGWTAAPGDGASPVTATTVVTAVTDHTIHARWTADTSVVSFDAKGGTPCAPIQVTFGQTYGAAAPGGALCAPTLTGHTFLGWVDAGGAPVGSGTTVARTDDHVLEATWRRQTYAVTFEAGEGTPSVPPGKVVTFATAYGSLGFTTRAGYTFAGWWTGAGAAPPEVTPETVVARAEAHTLYAAWTANRYTVSYNAQGGSACAAFAATYDLPYGVSAPGGVLCASTRPGYTFVGWFDADTADAAEVTAATEVTTPGDHTLHARWTANTYTVSFEGGLCASRLVRYAARYDLDAQTGLTRSLCTPSLAGSRFVSWCLDAACNTAISGSTIVATPANHTLYPRWEACPAGTYVDAQNTCVPCDATCATCSGPGPDACTGCAAPRFFTDGRCVLCGPGQIRVTYDPQGGIPTPPPDCRTIGAPFGPLASPTRSAHFLTGWFGSRAGADQWTSSTIIPVGQGDMTLYAQWAAGNGDLNVTYDNQGGSGCSTLVARYGQTYGLLAPNQTLCVPRRSGQTFAGWYTAAGGAGTQVVETTPVTRTVDHTLYARWIVTGNEFIVWPPSGFVRNHATTRFELSALGGTPLNTMQRYCYVIASGPGFVSTFGNIGTYVPPATSATDGQQVIVQVWPNDADDDCDDPGATKTEVILTLAPGAIGADVTSLPSAPNRQYVWTVAVGSKVDIGISPPSTYGDSVVAGYPVIESDADEDGTLSGTLTTTYRAPDTIAGDVAYDVLRWQGQANPPAGYPSVTSTWVYIRIVKVKQIDTGTGHVCAIDTLGELKCWGANAAGQLGLEDSTTTSVTSPWTRPWVSWQGRRALRVSAGYDHTCATFADGSASCWGNDGNGELGNGASATVPSLSNATPINLCGMYAQADCVAQTGCAWVAGACLTAGATLSDIQAGGNGSCGLRNDGRALCWGKNFRGTVGNGNNIDQQSPQLVTFRADGATAGPALTNKVIHLSISEATYLSYGQTACAVLDDGSPWCWGSDGYATGNEMLGGFGQDSSVPKPVTNRPPGRTYKKLMAGFGHNCGILDDNSVACFGEVNANDFQTPTTQMFTAVSQLAVGGYMTAAVSNGVLRTWGFGGQYSLGAGSLSNKASTEALSPDLGFTVIAGLATSSSLNSGNGSTTVVLRQDGRVMCFGTNDSGECAVASDVPVPVYVMP